MCKSAGTVQQGLTENAETVPAADPTEDVGTALQGDLTDGLETAPEAAARRARPEHLRRRPLRARRSNPHAPD